MLNPRFTKKDWAARAKPLEIDALSKAILKGDVVALSRGITLIESSRTEDRSKKNKLLENIFSNTGAAYRLGITGVPGVGKSTFIESFGIRAISRGYRVAVLSIDPSSSRSGGSILGDKTRMNALSKHNDAYVRPTASGMHLGGVAQSTRESMLLCEAAGYDLIIVETVGVGQSEIEAMQLTDFFLLLMLSGAGDELQGIKRGIMETADAIAITKADGDNIQVAKNAAQEYRRALHLMPPHEGEWIPKVGITSSLNNEGMDDVLSWIHQYKNLCQKNGYWNHKRQLQAEYWFDKHLQDQLLNILQANKALKDQLQKMRQSVNDLDIDPFQAAERLIQALDVRLE